MQQIKVSELRKHLPDYLRKVSQGEELQITNHGKVIARLIPENDEVEAARQRLKALRGTMILGDIVSPINDVVWTGDANNL